MNESKIIFLIENSSDYVFLLEQAFRRAQIHNAIKVARYGNEAILYLKGVGIYNDRINYPLPHILIIDIKITDGSGLGVIGWIRRQPQFVNMPIIILVEGENKAATHHAFEIEANAYFVKRDDTNGVAQMIKHLEIMDEFHNPYPKREGSIPVH